MNRYLHTIGFTLGLTAVIFLSSFNALFMTPNTEWFGALSKPYVNPTAHSLCWLVSYLITAWTIGEFVINKQLWKLSFLPAGFIALNVLWCFLFFRLHELISSCAVFVMIIATQSIILYTVTKRTKTVCFGALVNLLWYCYLFGIFIMVMVLN